MAANLQCRGIANRLLSFVGSSTRNAALSPSLITARRAVHLGVYDKNPEEHVHPSIVPDEVIQNQSGKYWTPHPQTGVFGPPTNHNLAAASDFHTVAAGQSVLELKAFFRPLEDLEKPPHSGF